MGNSFPPKKKSVWFSSPHRPIYPAHSSAVQRQFTLADDSFPRSSPTSWICRKLQAPVVVFLVQTDTIFVWIENTLKNFVWSHVWLRSAARQRFGHVKYAAIEWEWMNMKIYMNYHQMKKSSEILISFSVSPQLGLWPATKLDCARVLDAARSFIRLFWLKKARNKIYDSRSLEFMCNTNILLSSLETSLFHLFFSAAVVVIWYHTDSIRGALIPKTIE